MHKMMLPCVHREKWRVTGICCSRDFLIFKTLGKILLYIYTKKKKKIFLHTSVPVITTSSLLKIPQAKIFFLIGVIMPGSRSCRGRFPAWGACFILSSPKVLAVPGNLSLPSHPVPLCWRRDWHKDCE